MAKKETKKENNKNKKSFFKSFKAELKKVSWPTPKQLLNSTVAVVTIVLITAAIVFVLDLAFETLNKHGVDRIKQMIGTEQTQDQEETTNETDNQEESGEQENTEVNTEASNEESETENTQTTDENKTE